MYVFSTNKYLIKDRHIMLLACNAEILVASLSRFLLVEIPGKLVIVIFIFKRVNVDDIKKNKKAKLNTKLALLIWML